MNRRKPASLLLSRRKMPAFRAGPFEFGDPVLLCLFLYLLFSWDSSGFLRISLLASALHECGHVAAYAAMTGRLPVIRITVTGFCMRTAGAPFSRGQTALLAFAGPCANLVSAVVCAFLLQAHATVFLCAFFSANVLVGGFNLLPVPPLDGWQLVRLLVR